MSKIITKIFINAVALWAATYFIDGINLQGGVMAFVFVAIVFGLVNAFIKPIVQIFSLPLLIITIGLFTLVINGLMLSLTAYLTSALSVSGFGAAFWGSIVISIVSVLLNRLFREDDDDKKEVVVIKR